jgi:hypothetical protein
VTALSERVRQGDERLDVSSGSLADEGDPTGTSWLHHGGLRELHETTIRKACATARASVTC